MSLTPPPPYCDCTIYGSRVELVPGSHLVHNRQRVELPQGQNLLFPRLSDVGLRFAGIGHVDNHCWQWDGAQWIDYGPAEGPHAVIYDHAGVLHIVRETEGAPTGSQGWRYVDDAGTLVPAQNTYADVARGIYEYTTRGDITIGQGGDEEGLQALVRGRRVLLDSGVARFIRFYRQGDKLAVAYVKNHTEAKFLFLTVADLDALPTYALPSAPPPAPPPQPKPEPAPMPSIPDQTSAVARARAKYPTPLGLSHAACLIDICQEIGLNAGLLKKDSGTHITLPNGVKVSQDIICFPDGSIYDCLSDGEGQARPSWSHAEGGPFPDRYYRIGTVPTPEPEPQPTPTPQPEPSGELAVLRSRVAMLEGRVQGMGETLAQRLDALEQRRYRLAMVPE